MLFGEDHPILHPSRRLIFKFYRVLVLMEWVTGYGLGRPSSIHDEEYVPTLTPLTFLVNDTFCLVSISHCRRSATTNIG